MISQYHVADLLLSSLCSVACSDLTHWLSLGVTSRSGCVIKSSDSTTRTLTVTCGGAVAMCGDVVITYHVLHCRCSVSARSICSVVSLVLC